jgi:hypothetical protein
MSLYREWRAAFVHADGRFTYSPEYDEPEDCAPWLARAFWDEPGGNDITGAWLEVRTVKVIREEWARDKEHAGQP